MPNSIQLKFIILFGKNEFTGAKKGGKFVF